MNTEENFIKPNAENAKRFTLMKTKKELNLRKTETYNVLSHDKVRS